MPKKRTPKQVAPSPFWTLDDGISYSLLCQFIIDRERYRLSAVEGMREEKAASDKERMDWGTYFHGLLELRARHPYKTPQAIIALCKKSISHSEKQVANVVFEEYCEYYKQDNYKYFDYE